MRASLDVVVNNAVAAVGNGRYAGPVPPKEQFIQAYGAIAGEQQWARFNGSVQAAQTFQSIKNLGRAQLEQAIEAYKPDPTKETFAQDTQIYNALREAAQRTLTARADDPAKYIFSEYPEIRNAYEAADTPEDQRAVYAQMERTFERLGIPEGERFYMTEEQLRSVGQQYKNAEPEGKIAMLRQFTETMGARAGRTLGRFGGAEDVAQDFALSSMLRQMPGGDTTLLRVFEGRDAMAKDPARRPTPSTVQGEFRRLVGDGTIRNLDGDMSRMLREAATGIYVARGGNVDGGNLTDQTLFRESLREALGGVSGNANTGWFTSGGVTTILPPQVTRAQFENWAEGLDLADYTRYSGGHRIVDGRGRTVPVTDIIDDGRFVLVAVDTYGVVFSDGRLAQNERGQPFTMHVQLRPPRADAQRPATRRPVPNATSMR